MWLSPLLLEAAMIVLVMGEAATEVAVAATAVAFGVSSDSES